MSGGGLDYLPFCSVSSERVMEELKMNGVIGYGVGPTPHVEGSDMFGRMLASNTLKLSNV